MLFSIFYLILRGLLRLVPSGEEGREREVEILVLRHQLKVGRPVVRTCGARTEPCWPQHPACFRVSVGPPSSSGPRRFFAGTGNWSDANGPSEGSHSGARRCRRTCAS